MKQHTERASISLAALVLVGSSGCALLVDLGDPVKPDNVIAVGTGSNEPARSVPPSQGEGGAPSPSSPAPAPPQTCGADLANDPANCGFCGHGCAGSACSAGLCAPVTIVQTNLVRALAVDGDRLFYTTDRDVRSCPAVRSATCTSVASADVVSSAVRSGSGSNTTTGGIKIGPINIGGDSDEPPPSLDPRGLATFGDRFFVADETYDTVLACPKTGCTPQTIATVRPSADPDFAGGLFVDALQIAWGEKTGVGEAPLPSPGARVDGRLLVDPLTRDVRRVEIGSVGGNEQMLFLAADGVFALAYEATAVFKPILAAAMVRDFAADTQFAYVAASTSVVRVDRATRAQTTMLQVNGSSPERIVSDARGVYATIRGADETGLVRVYDNGTVDVLARSSSIGVIALTSEWVYYAGNGAIRRVAR